MSLTEDQIAMRREGITATDMGAIVGANPFRKAVDVWQEKRGIAPVFVEKAETRWGHKLEPMILSDYAERHSVRVERCKTLRHRKQRWAMATPDGLRFPEGAAEADGGLETKTHGDDVMRFAAEMQYGPEGTDEVPLHELIQCEWGMHVTELPRWDLILFDQRPREFVIDRDDELIGMLVEQAERFRRDHVLTGEPPPPDGSPSWNEFLKRRWLENKDSYIDADRDPAALALIHQLRDARAASADAKLREAKLAQQIKNLIGDKAGFSFHEPDRAKAARIHWKWAKPGSETDWKATYRLMREAAGLLVSAKAPVIELGAKLLRNIQFDGVAHDGRSLSSGPDAIDSVALAEVVEMLLQLAKSIATQEPIEKTKKAARPFNVPRHWPKSSQDDNNETEETESK